MTKQKRVLNSDGGGSSGGTGGFQLALLIPFELLGSILLLNLGSRYGFGLILLVSFATYYLARKVKAGKPDLSVDLARVRQSNQVETITVL